MATQFDVWFTKADQVYKGVPFPVVAGWVEQGRVTATDKVRSAGTNDAWQKIGDHPLLGDYLGGVSRAAQPDVGPALAIEALEAPEPEFLGHHGKEEEDDEVDMIPLIDVSLVLLVFFMMTTAISSLSPIDVPAISTGTEAQDDPEVVTINVELRDSGAAYFAIRKGAAGVLKENDNLETMPELQSRLDAILQNVTAPPDVRIACNKKVKHVRIRELATMLDPYRRKAMITGYKAEVNEQPK